MAPYSAIALRRRGAREAGMQYILSFRQKPESGLVLFWIPAFAGTASGFRQGFTPYRDTGAGMTTNTQILPYLKNSLKILAEFAKLNLFACSDSIFFIAFISPSLSRRSFFIFAEKQLVSPAAQIYS